MAKRKLRVKELGNSSSKEKEQEKPNKLPKDRREYVTNIQTTDAINSTITIPIISKIEEFGANYKDTYKVPYVTYKGDKVSTEGLTVGQQANVQNFYVDEIQTYIIGHTQDTVMSLINDILYRKCKIDEKSEQYQFRTLINKFILNTYNGKRITKVRNIKKLETKNEINNLIARWEKESKKVRFDWYQSEFDQGLTLLGIALYYHGIIIETHTHPFDSNEVRQDIEKVNRIRAKRNKRIYLQEVGLYTTALQYIDIMVEDLRKAIAISR